ncbi:hypothetical protein EI94DRAFT_929186 [Lactarius quietus]|nr:hypothetical protein EI94DRAFT_929186 [Lactarius quietus]
MDDAVPPAATTHLSEPAALGHYRQSGFMRQYILQGRKCPRRAISCSMLENRSNARTKSLTERATDTFSCARKFIKKGFFLLVHRSSRSSSSDRPEEASSNVHHQGKAPSIRPKALVICYYHRRIHRIRRLRSEHLNGALCDRYGRCISSGRFDYTAPCHELWYCAMTKSSRYRLRQKSRSMSISTTQCVYLLSRSFV